MSLSLSVTAYAGKDNLEFQKHFRAVKFCIEEGLSFPKETSEFFRGRVDGEDLEDIRTDCILPYIENGIEVSIPTDESPHGDRISIKIATLPAHVDEIVIQLR